MTTNLTTKRVDELVPGDRYVLTITEADDPDAVRVVEAIEWSPYAYRVVVHHRGSEWKRHLGPDRLVVIVPEPRTVDRLALDSIVLPEPKPAREHLATVALFGPAVTA